MLKSVNIRWYQRLPYIKTILMPVRFSQNLEDKFEQLMG
jgi:hypothetical protein